MILLVPQSKQVISNFTFQKHCQITVGNINHKDAMTVHLYYMYGFGVQHLWTTEVLTMIAFPLSLLLAQCKQANPSAVQELPV